MQLARREASPPARRRGGRPGPRSQGVALIIVLWITVLLTVIAGAFAFSMRNEALASRNTVELAQVRVAADGGIDRTVFELQRPGMPATKWKTDGRPHRWTEGPLLLEARARDEGGKIDLNTAREGLLKGLLVNVGGLDDGEASAVLDAIIDWRDADELRRPNGAEAPDYDAIQSKFKPSNAPFESVGELSRVKGVTPAVFQQIAPALTVHSRQGGINAASADRAVLLALPQATAEMVDDYILRRDVALAQNLPVPPFPPAQAFPAGALPVWRIQVQAMSPDGVTFVREAVVRATADPRQPYFAYLWSEGARPLVPPPAAATAASPMAAQPAS